MQLPLELLALGITLFFFHIDIIHIILNPSFQSVQLRGFGYIHCGVQPSHYLIPDVSISPNDTDTRSYCCCSLLLPLQPPAAANLSLPWSACFGHSYKWPPALRGIL